VPTDWKYRRPDGTFDKRWDDPKSEFRVTYASESRLGAYLETCASFRPNLELEAQLARIKGGEDAGFTTPPPGFVPREWREKRVIGQAIATGKWAIVGHSRSLSWLRREMAADALQLGVREVDGSSIRLTAPRGFTQRISRRLWECRAEDAQPMLDGIRYLSKYGDDVANYGRYEDRGAVNPGRSQAIAADDADLIRAASLLRLSIDA
jgi:hypothetical protein